MQGLAESNQHLCEYNDHEDSGIGFKKIRGIWLVPALLPHWKWSLIGIGMQVQLENKPAGGLDASYVPDRSSINR